MVILFSFVLDLACTNGSVGGEDGLTYLMFEPPPPPGPGTLANLRGEDCFSEAFFSTKTFFFCVFLAFLYSSKGTIFSNLTCWLSLAL